MIYSPTLRDRNDLLRGSERQFRISDESAYSIVPSDISTSIYTGRTNDSGVAKVEEDLVYKPLTFENELFTSRVYKRNYATPAFRRLFKEQKWKPSNKTTPSVVAKETAEDPDGSIAEILTIREPGRSYRWHNEAQLATLTPTEGQSAGDQDTSGEINMWPHAEPRISFAEACKQGNVEIVERFLKSDQGVHVPVVGSTHTFHLLLDLSAIHVAAEGGHVQVVEILLSYGADKEMLSDISQRRPLHLAVQAGHIAMVRYLLDNGTDIAAPDGDSVQAIHVAAEYGSTALVSFLLDRGAAIDSAMRYGVQPLHSASQTPGRADVIKFLCCQGANIEAAANGYTPLSYACLHNAVDNMEALLELGAVHSPQGPSILEIALERGRSQATRLLLDHGLDPNRPVSGRPSALHALYSNDYRSSGHAETLELLLVYGADVNLQDSKGDTPLHRLCSHSGIPIKRRRLEIQMATFLAKSMRDVEVINFAGKTALGVSVEKGSSEWLGQPLIDFGSGLLLRKPHIELGLNLHQPSGGDPFSDAYLLYHLDCYARKGSDYSIKRLRDYHECFTDDLSELRRRMDILRRWLRDAEWDRWI